MGIGLEGAFGNQAGQVALTRLLAQRMAREKIARDDAQQAFENQMREKQFQSTEDLKRAQLEDIAQNRSAQENNLAAQRGIAASEATPAGFYPQTPDTARVIGMIRAGGGGGRITTAVPLAPMGPEFQGPMPTGETPQGAQLGRPGGYLLSATARQADVAADNARQVAAEARADTAQRETARHNRVMENRPVGGLMSGGPTGGLSSSGLDLAAAQYAQTGQMPPLGMGSAGARSAIINRAAELFPDTNIAQSTARFSADKTSLANVQKMRDAVGAFEQTASKNSKVMEGAAKQLTDTKSPWLNRPFREVEQRGMGDPNVAAFSAARRVVVNEYARIVSNPNLAGVLSDEARQEMDSVLSGDATIPQIMAVLTVLRSDAENRRTSFDDTLAQIHGRIGGGASTRSPSGNSKRTYYDANGNPIQQ